LCTCLLGITNNLYRSDIFQQNLTEGDYWVFVVVTWLTANYGMLILVASGTVLHTMPNYLFYIRTVSNSHALLGSVRSCKVSDRMLVSENQRRGLTQSRKNNASGWFLWLWSGFQTFYSLFWHHWIGNKNGMQPVKLLLPSILFGILWMRKTKERTNPSSPSKQPMKQRRLGMPHCMHAHWHRMGK